MIGENPGVAGDTISNGVGVEEEVGICMGLMEDDILVRASFVGTSILAAPNKFEQEADLEENDPV
ncbi:unnamed protein product [Umbelopsis sp. WA50703]